ncbi:MAG: EF-hand domain-containing protein [Cyclobacteriaceae bacterium]
MLSEVQRKKLTHFFNILDHNGNGVLQLDDFTDVGENLCITLGFKVDTPEHASVINQSKKLFHRLIGDIKKNSDWNIRLNEWLEFFDREVLNAGDYSVLKYYIKLTTKYLFDLYDQDKDGNICIEEYIDMFTIYRIDVKYSARSFLRLDSDNNEYISKTELVNAVADFFVTSDEEADGNWIFGNWDY